MRTRSVLVALGVVLALGSIIVVALRAPPTHDKVISRTVAPEVPLTPTLAPSEAKPEATPNPPPAEPTADSGPTSSGSFRVPVVLRYASGKPIVGKIELGLKHTIEDEVFVDEVFPKASFEISVDRPGTYRVFQLEIDGERYASLPKNVELASGAKIDWVLEDPRPAILEVVDAATGAPLSTARAYRYQWARDGKPLFDAPLQIPSRATLAVPPIEADQSGRITLPALWGQTPWYVIAPGRAWASVYAVHAGDVPTRIELAPGGSLLLEVVGWSKLASPTVDIQWGHGGRPRMPDRTTTVETPEGPMEVVTGDELPEGDGTPSRLLELPFPDSQGRLSVTGLPIGLCGVGVRRGSWFENGELYGSGTVEIRPGETARLTIQVDLEKVRHPVAIGGTVRVPKSWAIDRLGVRLEGEDAQTSGTTRRTWFDVEPGDPVALAWEPVPPGRYQLTVYPTEWRTWVDVSTDGARLDVRVPEPCDGEVRVVDAVTKLAIEGAEVSWAFHLAGDGGHSIEDAKWDATTNVYRFRAPEGSVILYARAKGYKPFGWRGGHRPVQIARAAPLRTTIELQRGGTVVVLLRVDGKPLALTSSDVSVTLTYDSGTLGQSISQGEARFEGLDARTWGVRVDDIPGFHPVARREVELKGGETAEVVIDLERK